MQRIFLTTSHLSTVFITLYAKHTSDPGQDDILLIDHAPKRQSLVRHIKETAAQHAWRQVIDLSIAVSDAYDLKPTFVKRATRHLKHKLVFKQVYDALYKMQQARRVTGHIGLLRSHMQVRATGTKLFLMTETALNDALYQFFPGSQVSFFEHGLSDYLLAPESTKKDALFYCVFADQYKSYLDAKGMPAGFVRSYFDPESFKSICDSFFNGKTEAKLLSDLAAQPGRCCLLLLQNLEMYQVDKDFWTLYIDRCLRQVANPEEYTFLIKPHPHQSSSTLLAIGDYLSAKKIKYKVLADAASAQMSIELAFSLLQQKVHYVFSPFSSAVFYLSRLFPLKPTVYYHSYEWFKREHLQKAPPQFRKLFLSAEELIKGVFSANCKEI